jgi:SHS2 domain-containing protein
MQKAFETFDHTADIGIRAFGQDLPGAFCNAAKGMFGLITDLKKVRSSHKTEIELTAADQPSLLMDWLNELLYHFDAEQLLLKKFTISELSDTRLKAECWGEPADRIRHQLKRGIKAATYHGLKIEPAASGFQIEVILDL